MRFIIEPEQKDRTYEGARKNPMPQQHPRQVREAAVQLALTGQGSQEQIAEDNGVGLSTLQRWIRIAKSSGEPVMAKKEKRLQDWTREERLNALLEAAKLSDQELGAWCRQKGLHTHHLEKWRKELAQEHTRESSSFAGNLIRGNSQRHIMQLQIENVRTALAPGP